MTINKMKELYATGDWICINKSIDTKYHTDWIITQSNHFKSPNREYKLIHKRHRPILDEYLKNPNIEIEYFTNFYDGDNIWSTCDKFIDMYKDDLEYKIKEKPMIDLNNTWCEATEEHYNKLIELGFKIVPKSVEGYTCMIPNHVRKGQVWMYSDLNYIPKKNRKIHLIDGEFKIVEEEEMTERANEDCQFTKYGFVKPSFECEITAKVKDRFIGYVLIDNKVEPARWSLRGYCNLGKNYKLTPIEKPWYEDSSNFPTMITYETDGEGNNPMVWVHYYTDGKVFDMHGFGYSITGITNWRRAKQEEIDSIKGE